MNLDDVRLFAAVARAGSFAHAASAEGVARSTLSRIVQRLEVEAGVPLLHRTTRRVGLTTAGAALLAKVQPSLAALDEAIRAFRAERAEPAGLLRITTSTDIAASLLAPAVARLTRAHPLLRIETVLTLRAVDLIAERVDVALRVYAGPVDEPVLRGRRLMDLAFEWYAAPAYLERRGAPQDEADLAAHDVVAVGRLAPNPRIHFDDSFFGLAVVQAGAGVGLLPRRLCAAAVAEGTLVRVLPGVTVAQGQLWLVYPPGGLSTNVAAFRDALLAVIAEQHASG